MKLELALFFCMAGPWLGAGEWKAGAAKTPMTPQGPLFMAGYGDRTKPGEGVAGELYAKALALESPNGERAVMVTTDMLGFPAGLSRAIASRVEKQYGVRRDHLLLNSSHTHCGPLVVGMQAAPTWAMSDKDWDAVKAYTEEFTEKVVAVAGEAIRNLAPARLSYGTTLASFGVHRRMPGGKTWGPNYAGPADHDVPVLRVEGQDGALRAVVFGYGSHNTTIGIYQFHGDYAGAAQKWLETRYPGTVALFMMGCGGDVKPYPNGTVELAESYGASLAAAVDARMRKPLQPVAGSLRTVFDTVPLQFGEPPTRAQLAARAKGDSSLLKRHAEAMVKILDRDGRFAPTYPEPVQAWQFGSDLTLVALGGEVTSEYALRLKKEIGAEKLWVAGYSNDVFAYIPSKRIIEEGGYEAGVSSMEFYLQPGPWSPSIEETLIAKIHEVLSRVRAEK